VTVNVPAVVYVCVGLESPDPLDTPPSPKLQL